MRKMDTVSKDNIDLHSHYTDTELVLQQLAMLCYVKGAYVS